MEAYRNEPERFTSRRNRHGRGLPHYEKYQRRGVAASNASDSTARHRHHVHHHPDYHLQDSVTNFDLMAMKPLGNEVRPRPIAAHPVLGGLSISGARVFERPSHQRSAASNPDQCRSKTTAPLAPILVAGQSVVDREPADHRRSKLPSHDPSTRGQQAVQAQQMQMPPPLPRFVVLQPIKPRKLVESEAALVPSRSGQDSVSDTRSGTALRSHHSSAITSRSNRLFAELDSTVSSSVELLDTAVPSLPEASTCTQCRKEISPVLDCMEKVLHLDCDMTQSPNAAETTTSFTSVSPTGGMSENSVQSHQKILSSQTPHINEALQEDDCLYPQATAVLDPALSESVVVHASKNAQDNSLEPLGLSSDVTANDTASEAPALSEASSVQRTGRSSARPTSSKVKSRQRKPCRPRQGRY